MNYTHRFLQEFIFEESGFIMTNEQLCCIIQNGQCGVNQSRRSSVLSDVVSKKEILWKKRFQDGCGNCLAAVIIYTNRTKRGTWLTAGEKDLLITYITDTFPEAKQKDIRVEKKCRWSTGEKSWVIWWKTPKPGIPIKTYPGWRGAVPTVRTNIPKDEGSNIKLIESFRNIFSHIWN